jgi:hypothetical protein
MHFYEAFDEDKKIGDIEFKSHTIININIKSFRGKKAEKKMTFKI